ncbi:hypothetical protein BASA81_006424 [Batrachochytrium salamandrivorans]|nr:hypothetical protein BASA81_006424 [Batrachochytrium salamandrivorans]
MCLGVGSATATPLMEITFTRFQTPSHDELVRGMGNWSATKVFANLGPSSTFADLDSPLAKLLMDGRSQITHLGMSNVHDWQVDLLVEVVFPRTKICSLDLSDFNHLTGESLKRLVACQQLQAIRICDSNIGDSAAMECNLHSGLIELDLEQSAMTAIGINSLLQRLRNPRVFKVFTLQRVHALPEEFFPKLVQAMSTLTELSLTLSHPSQLNELLVLGNVTSLKLGYAFGQANRALDLPAAERFATAVANNSNVTSLSLMGILLSPQAVERLLQRPSPGKLHHLLLRDCDLHSFPLTESTLDGLVTLDLAVNSIPADVLLRLADRLAHSRLRKVVLDGNHVTKQVTLAMLRSLRHPGCFITELSLGDEFYHHPYFREVNRTLKHIIVARGLVALRTAQEVPSLGARSALRRLPRDLIRLVALDLL